MFFEHCILNSIARISPYNNSHFHFTRSFNSFQNPHLSLETVPLRVTNKYYNQVLDKCCVVLRRIHRTTPRVLTNVVAVCERNTNQPPGFRAAIFTLFRHLSSSRDVLFKISVLMQTTITILTTISSPSPHVCPIPRMAHTKGRGRGGSEKYILSSKHVVAAERSAEMPQSSSVHHDRLTLLRYERQNATGGQYPHSRPDRKSRATTTMNNRDNKY